MKFRELFRPSGGIYYHLRALRNRSRWSSFAARVEEWLKEWRPSEGLRGELLLLGPSAGYTLPDSWLNLYRQVIAVDLDPLAPFLFSKNHRQCQVKFRAENLFWRDGRLTLEPLQRILKKHPDADILFCNLLGQVLLEGRIDESDWAVFLADLRSLLKDRRWASFHDLRSRRGREETDHLMKSEWSADLPRRITTWQVTPATAHEIEFVFNN